MIHLLWDNSITPLYSILQALYIIMAGLSTYCNDQGIIFFRTWLPKLESLAAGVRCFFNVLVVNTHYDSWSDHLLGPQTTF